MMRGLKSLVAGHPFVAATTIVVVIAAIVMIAQDNATLAPTLQKSPLPVAMVRFGPGVWSGDSDRRPSVRDWATPHMALTIAAGNLVQDEKLLAVFDQLLLGGMPSSRQQRYADLQAQFKQVLVAPALQQAEQSARNYLEYMDAHDAMLTRLGMPTALANPVTPHQIEMLRTWQVQRAQIRQRVLGRETAQAWYQHDEQEFEQTLIDLNAQLVQSEQTMQPPLHANLQAHQDYLRFESINAALTSFAERERQEQQWNERYAAYRTAAETQHAKLDQLEQLRTQYFQSVSERQRARLSDRL